METNSTSPAFRRGRWAAGLLAAVCQWQPRVPHRFDQHWTASLGLDNLGNATYWAFHPYTQRTLHAELKFNH